MRKYIQLISRPTIARDPRQPLILDSTPWIPDSVEIGFQIPFFFVGLRIPRALFRIPKPRIPDSPCKKFSDSRVQIPLHETIVNRTLLPTADSNEIPGESCRRWTETSSPVITDQFLCIRSPLTASCCYCSLPLSKHQETSSSIPLYKYVI